MQCTKLWFFRLLLAAVLGTPTACNLSHNVGANSSARHIILVSENSFRKLHSSAADTNALRVWCSHMQVLHPLFLQSTHRPFLAGADEYSQASHCPMISASLRPVRRSHSLLCASAHLETHKEWNLHPLCSLMYTLQTRIFLGILSFLSCFNLCQQSSLFPLCLVNIIHTIQSQYTIDM